MSKLKFNTVYRLTDGVEFKAYPLTVHAPDVVRRGKNLYVGASADLIPESDAKNYVLLHDDVTSFCVSKENFEFLYSAKKELPADPKLLQKLKSFAIHSKQKIQKWPTASEDPPEKKGPGRPPKKSDAS